MRLILKQKWLRQPQYPIQLDRNCPFTDRLDLALLPCPRLVNLAASPATLAIGTKTPSQYSGPMGVAVRLPSGEGDTYAITNARAPVVSCAVLVVLNQCEGGGIRTSFLTTGGPDRTYLSGTNIPGIFVADTERAVGTTALIVEKPNVVGYFIKDNDYRTYLNGILVGSQAGGFGINGAWTFLGGNVGFGTQSSDVALILAWNDVDNIGLLMAELSLNPWQVFRPQRRRLYVTAAAAAATTRRYSLTLTGVG